MQNISNGKVNFDIYSLQ